ncbi:DNA-damage-inducible protein D domain protein, partial [Escherichia coli OK1357]
MEWAMNEHHQPFEEIRHYGTEGQEFWSARELAPLLDYRDWRNFQKVLARATQACEA